MNFAEKNKTRQNQWGGGREEAIKMGKTSQLSAKHPEVVVPELRIMVYQNLRLVV